MNAQQEAAFYNSQNADARTRQKDRLDEFWHYTSEDGAAWKRYLAERERENGEGR